MKQNALVVIAVAGIAFVGGVFSEPYVREHIKPGYQIRSGSGTWTNPLLECEVARGAIDSAKFNFEPELRRYITNISRSENIVSVYFRDLNNGPAFGINEEKKYIPGSLLKLPVLMVILHNSERNPALLDELLRYSINANGLTTYIPVKKLTNGESYSVSTLLRQMIIESDNDALAAVTPLASESELDGLFERIGVGNTTTKELARGISIEQYSAFFRILFNASYLEQDMSELALSILGSSNFDQGMRAWIPRDIPVAHKFGEFTHKDGSQYLHDCGIVYYPDHPYLLCLMTEVRDVDEGLELISGISRFVYEKIHSQYLEKIPHTTSAE